MNVRVAVALTVALCALRCAAHHPIVNGTTTGPTFATWQTALKIPTNLISLSVKRLSYCRYPYFWLKYTGKKGATLDVSATTTAAAAWANVRLSVAVFGPRLPKRTKKFAFPTPKTTGALVLAGPKSVASCSFIKNQEKRDGYSIINKRCGTYSNTTGVGYFPILDNAWRLPATGTYYFAFFTQGQYHAWYSVATGSPTHSHGDVPGVPKVSPVGNGPKGLNFYDLKVKSKCCVPKCAARKIYV